MNALTDAQIRLQGMEALIATLGPVYAERFVSLMMREAAEGWIAVATDAKPPT